VLLACVAIAGAAVRNNNPLNSFIVWEDSVRVDSTETKRMTAAWIDNGAQLALVVEARDDSSAGFADDSASVAMSVYQVWPVTKGDSRYFVRLPSRAHPDSTTVLFDGGADFRLWDSLHIADMDTAAVYLRNTVSGGGVLNRQADWGDSLKTLQTTGWGAFAYRTWSPDYSSALEFELTGNAANKIGGVGSMWKLRLYQLRGEKVVAE
jgi:hypothetical protein